MKDRSPEQRAHVFGILWEILPDIFSFFVFWLCISDIIHSHYSIFIAEVSSETIWEHVELLLSSLLLHECHLSLL